MARKLPQTLPQEPLSAWSVAEFTLEDIRAAYRAAQSGLFYRAAGIAEIMLGDDRIAATMAVRIRALLGSTLRITPVDERGGEAIARALEKDVYAIAPENTLYELLAWALLVGAVPVALAWETAPSGRLIPRLRPWHPQWLRLDIPSRTWYVQTAAGEIVPDPLSFWIFSPYGEHPWRNALWRTLALPWLVKNDAVRLWARDNEVGALRVASTTAPSTPQAKEELAKALSELGADTGIVLPEGHSLAIVAPPGDIWRSKEAVIAWADRAIAVTLLGQNLTTEVERGSYAAAMVHELVRQDVLEADAETLATGFREGVISLWTEINFGNRKLTPWVEWDPARPRDEGERAEILEKLARALGGFAQAGVPVDTEEILAEFGLPVAGSGSRVGLKRKPRVDGFVSGQLYVDALVDAYTRRAGLDIEALASIVKTSRDYDELRGRLIKAFPTASPDEFARLMEKALLLADLAGRWAVQSDLEE